MRITVKRKLRFVFLRDYNFAFKNQVRNRSGPGIVYIESNKKHHEMNNKIT